MTETDRLHPRLLAARLAYVGVILLATLSDLSFEPAVDPVADRLSRAVSLDVRARDIVDGVRNLLLFGGWGLVWSLTAHPRRLWHSIAIATLTGALLSVGVETAQLFSPQRRASVLDVLTNTGGALAGAVTAVVLLRSTAAARGSRSFVGVPMFLLAAAYSGAALLEIVLPGLRQDLLPGATGGPFSRFRLAIQSVALTAPAVGDLVLQVLLMIPAGALAVAAFVEQGTGYRRGLGLSVTGGAGLALALELARGATGQPIEPVLFATHAGGVGLGAWLAFRFLPPLTVRVRGRARPLALLGAYSALLALWRWRPFDVELDLASIRASFAPMHIVPLQAMAMKMDLFSASVVAVGFLLHVPVGAVLAVWPLRFRGALSHVLPGLYLVALFEIGQIFIAGRYFDLTDILIGVAGVLTGWIVVRRAGFRPYGEALSGR